MTTERKRILIVQYAGDYREAYHRLQATGAETYYGHRYVLEQLEGLQRDHGEVAMVCCLSPEAYHETLPNGLTVIGAKAHPKKQAGRIKQIMADWNPTHLVVLGPLTALIRWGVATNRKVLCQFADSFDIHPLMRLLKYGRLAPLLNGPGVDWISNHGVNACRSLARIGVKPDKLLAWDWPYVRRPDQTAVRTLGAGPHSLLYVGTIQPKKGVGDAIGAVAELKRRGVDVTLKIAGGGQVAAFETMATELDVADRVDFLGLIPNTTVFDAMQAATAVVVPSRHDYPEGLPLTIYESLCARTPIVASDHPMFAGHLVDRQTAMVFPAGRPQAMADSIQALLADPALYAAISEATLSAWERMQNPVKWGDVLRRWVEDTAEDRKWFSANRVKL